MIDTFNINDNSLQNQVFYYNGPTGWQVWNKPPKCNLVNFFLLGGGAGGQGGQVNASSTRNGGSGGGSAAFAYITVPAFALPDTLYILVASGGTGGVSGGSPQGGQGSLSYVCSAPDTSTVNNILMRSGSANAGVSTCATAGAAITAADILLAEAAFISGYAGQTGGAGGVSSGTATDVTPTGIPVTAGAGGAGCSSVGTLGVSADIVGILDFPIISGGTNTAVAGATAGAGNHGFSTRENFIGPNFKYPMFFTGGAGGGAASNATGIGGRGGDGAYGCGGGGGGAGGNTTAGAGGNGGNGLVIITVT